MKSVLLSNLSYFGKYGGVENSIRFISNSLLKMNYDVIILYGYIKNDDRFQRTFFSDGIKYYSFKYQPFNSNFLNKFYLPVAILELIYTFYLIKVDNNVTHSISRNQFVCYFANKFFNGRNTYIAPGFSQFQSSKNFLGSSGFFRKIKNKLHNYFDFQAIAMSNRIIVFSDNMLKQAKQVIATSTLPTNIVQIEISKPGVDRKIFHPIKTSEKNIIRQKLGLSEHDLIILCVGRFVAAKGFDIAIKSMALVKDKRLFLVIVGDGLLFDNYRQLIQDLNLTKKILLVGPTNSVSDYYKASDYFLMSSIYEPLGQTILESIACGVPVIAFKDKEVITATHEILGDTACTYVDNVEPLTLANSLSSLDVLDSESYKEKVTSSLTLANDFTWDKLAIQLIN
ncbi:glycosyltransferase [Shewanella polaris]|uniref:Glycosyltransferase n=1 Tax=Shewanella polaris TaxID=2588449 RepID=A0A4Y5YD74_9GAMM|nr:glycosyltransferase [Shewanella polaris]QDE30509.1 glycosyltransferase [Shewanella polaris]